VSAEPAQPAPEIRVLAGNPSPEEIAAVTAVLTAALEQLSGESRRRGEAGLSAWQQSQRAIRHPLGRGAWGNFPA
jgi:hypothetical protein